MTGVNAWAPTLALKSKSVQLRRGVVERKHQVRSVGRRSAHGASRPQCWDHPRDNPRDYGCRDLRLCFRNPLLRGAPLERRPTPIGSEVAVFSFRRRETHLCQGSGFQQFSEPLSFWSETVRRVVATPSDV